MQQSGKAYRIFHVSRSVLRGAAALPQMALPGERYALGTSTHKTWRPQRSSKHEHAPRASSDKHEGKEVELLLWDAYHVFTQGGAPWILVVNLVADLLYILSTHQSLERHGASAAARCRNLQRTAP